MRRLQEKQLWAVLYKRTLRLRGSPEGVTLGGCGCEMVHKANASGNLKTKLCKRGALPGSAFAARLTLVSSNSSSRP